MNWHDGLILVWQLYGYGFKSWETQIKLYFYFANVNFGRNWKG